MAVHPLEAIRAWLGLRLERRRARRLAEAKQAWRPALDLTKPRHKRLLAAFVLGGFGFVVVSILGAHRAYVFTESTEFCGTLCHTPMQPQYGLR